MTELIEINDIFDELKKENNRLLSELCFIKNKYKYLENYRKFSLDFIPKCICDENKIKKINFNKLENIYNDFLKIYSNEETINTNKIKVKEEICNDQSFEVNNQTTDQQIVIKYLENRYRKQLNDKSNDYFEEELDENLFKSVTTISSDTVGEDFMIDNNDISYDSSIQSNKSFTNSIDIDIKDEIIDEIKGTETESLNNNQSVPKKRNRQKTYNCKRCEYSTHKIRHLRRHELIHENVEIFKCYRKGCEYQTDKRRSLVRHEIRHKQMKHFCNWIGCEKAFQSQDLLQRHLSVHQKAELKKDIIVVKKPKVCGFEGCEKQFSDRTGVRKHQMSAHFGIKDPSMKQLAEMLDKEEYETVVNIEDNVKEFRRQTQPGVYRKFGFGCNWDECKYINRQRKAVIYHIKLKHTFDKPFICKKCDFKCVNNNLLTRHINLKHNEDIVLYQCTHPGCQFKTKYSSCLSKHSVRHTGIKEFGCDWPGCEARFYTLSDLKRHQPLHSEARPLACKWPGCTDTFKYPDSLARHNRSHTGEKPFVCLFPECGRSFPSHYLLRDHEDLHLGVKRFECKECGKKFRSSVIRRSHMKTHMKNKLKSKDICLPLSM